MDSLKVEDFNPSLHKDAIHRTLRRLVMLMVNTAEAETPATREELVDFMKELDESVERFMKIAYRRKR